MFYSGGEFGSATLERAGLDTVTPSATTHILQRSPAENTCNNATTLLPALCHLPSHLRVRVSHIEETWIFCVIMFLKPYGAKNAVEPLYGSTYMVDCGAQELKFFLTQFLENQQFFTSLH